MKEMRKMTTDSETYETELSILPYIGGVARNFGFGSFKKFNSYPLSSHAVEKCLNSETVCSRFSVDITTAYLFFLCTKNPTAKWINGLRLSDER